jgi:soluble lytic murein transglycosylase
MGFPYDESMAGRRKAIWRTVGVAACVTFVLYAGLVCLRILYPLERLDLVRAQAEAAGLDSALVCSLVRAESRFHADAVSTRGAIGLLQLMPDTASWIAGRLGVATFRLGDPKTNLQFGTWYLRYLMDRFGAVDLALAAYNAGPSRVDQWLATGETAFPETEAFVRRVRRSMPVYHILLAAPILVQITPSLLF